MSHTPLNVDQRKKSQRNFMRQLQSVTEHHRARLFAENAMLNVTEPWAKAAVSQGAVSRDGRWEMLSDCDLLTGLLLLFSCQVVSDSV